MKMIFKGAQGSMGLNNGQQYSVTVVKGPLFSRYPLWVEIYGPSILVAMKCPYSSFEAFFRNWEVKLE